jgi:hypothetical protein
MALPNRLRPKTLAQNVERVIRETSREDAARPSQESAAPQNTKPRYSKVNAEAVEYGDTRHALGVNQAKTVSPANAGRRYLFILNVGANAVNISFGKPASGVTGVPLPANGFYEPLVPPAGSINAFSVAGSEIVVIEG